MTTAFANLIPFPRPFSVPRTPRVREAESVIGEAILRRHLVKLVYGGAVEPQMFAPYVLYFGACKNVFAGGFEIARKHKRWRDFELEHLKSVALTDTRFTPGSAFRSTRSNYPHGYIFAVDFAG